MTEYFRPLAQTEAHRPAGAKPIAGGWTWFTHAEHLRRGHEPQIVTVSDLPAQTLERITARRMSVAGLDLVQPRLMGILNVTPDSFSDGGRFDDFKTALDQAEHMRATGADILDIGGESTRPGADPVADEVEIARTAPVIAALRAQGLVPISIDTRKAVVARAALDAGADLVNDVSALCHDPALAVLVSAEDVPVCLMHAQGAPKTMQADPRYDDVLLDVYDALSARVEAAEAAGIARARIIVDPGIGFGKTVAHNLALLRGIALFHALGCPIMLGASRKRFIGTLADAPDTDDRVPGTISVTLAALAQGVQIHRVHDIGQMRQAVTLWQAATGTGRQE